jgi:hypothetical protein
LENHDLFHAKSYDVQGSVPVSVFETFVDSLKTQQKLTVTRENAAALSLLAKEFFLSELAAECSSFSVDSLSGLCERVANLERQLSSLPTRLEIDEQFGSHERQLASLCLRLSQLSLDSGLVGPSRIDLPPTGEGAMDGIICI